ncbi:hypothetical protein HNQ56_000779, partial [Anaerotaenia torta]|uniref:hypothetical protein n=1 Tax=Anaerotaenia torta TaxID=433293 RepID=UPI003D1E1354
AIYTPENMKFSTFFKGRWNLVLRWNLLFQVSISQFFTVNSYLKATIQHTTKTLINHFTFFVQERQSKA